MRLATLKETRPGEARVALTPDTVRKLIGLGLQVAVETGAGAASGIADDDYAQAGAVIEPDALLTVRDASIIFAVNPPDPAWLPRGALLVCQSGAAGQPGVAESFAAAGVDVAALELLPRITRAQSMDILSSQSNLAGYRAVIECSYMFQRGFPMMMTAAGTVPPARVFVIGAGVAGLQAIATARRLGAIVSATDVRPAAKEEIRSLGATFVGVEDSETAGQTGAYAGAMSEAFQQKQADLIAATVAKQDVVICTALIPGRRAPIILTNAMLDTMRSGSVVADLAAEGGGNCEATLADEAIRTASGVVVLGYRNWAARIPVAATQLYARNLLTFLSTFWSKEQSKLVLPTDDPIVQGVMLTQNGAVIHPRFLATA